MIELPQAREFDWESDIVYVKLFRTPWGIVNDEARIEVMLHPKFEGDGFPLYRGALGQNEVLQLARDALSLLPGKQHLKMVTLLNKEIRARRSWNQIGEKNGRQEVGAGRSRSTGENGEREAEENV